jgi:hypothetical protein
LLLLWLLLVSTLLLLLLQLLVSLLLLVRLLPASLLVISLDALLLLVCMIVVRVWMLLPASSCSCAADVVDAHMSNRLRELS